MFSQPVTKDFVLRQLDKLSPDSLVEVARFIEFLQFNTQQPLHEGASGEHAAFGIWADHTQAGEPATFASKLRQQIETRQDAAANTPD